MNDLDKLEVRKIRKRIEIKRSNLKILLPEVNFLQFIDELEHFQQIIEGVDTDGPIPQVQLSLVRLRFESLQNQYNALIRLLADGVKRAAEHSNDILLKDLLQAIQESTLFLLASFHNFNSRIATSTDLLYNIKAIVVIRDLLLDLKAEVNIVRKNFYNLEKSTAKDQARNILSSIYIGALASSCLKFEQLSRTFPKFRRFTVQQLAYKINRLNMAEEVQDVSKEIPEEVEIEPAEANLEVKAEAVVDVKDEPKNETHVEEEQENKSAEEAKDPSSEEVTDVTGEKLYSSEVVDTEEGKTASAEQQTADATEEKTDQEEKTDDVEGVSKEKEGSEEKLEGDTSVEVGGEEAHDAPSSPKESGTLPVSPSKISIDQIKNEFQSNIYQQRTRIENSLSEILFYEIKVRDNHKVIDQQRRLYKQDYEQLEKQKRTIAENDMFTDDEIIKKVQDMTLQMDQLTGFYQERITHLEAEMEEWKKELSTITMTVLEILKELRDIKHHAFESIKSSYTPATEDAPSLEQILEEFEIIYSENAGILIKIESVEKLDVDNEGVFYFDEANTRVYITKAGDDLPEADRPKITPSKELTFLDDEKSSIIQDQSGTQTSRSQSKRTVSQTTPDSFLGSSRDYTQEVHEIPLDGENYIKTHLGRPLRQALAAITINQPSDPINYLANYLLQYRYNELRNLQRQQDFENLLLQRKQYAKKLQLENMRHEMRVQQCDPCNRTTPQNTQ